MTVSSNDLEKKLVVRINRVKGQLTAISRMIEEGEDSKKISMQISAAVSGIESIKESYLKVRLLEETMKTMAEVMDSIKN